jgi:hypothetical protein
MEWADQPLAFNPFDPTDQTGQLPASQEATDWGFGQVDAVDFLEKARQKQTIQIF